MRTYYGDYISEHPGFARGLAFEAGNFIIKRNLKIFVTNLDLRCLIYRTKERGGDFAGI